MSNPKQKEDKTRLLKTVFSEDIDIKKIIPENARNDVISPRTALGIITNKSLWKKGDPFDKLNWLYNADEKIVAKNEELKKLSIFFAFALEPQNIKLTLTDEKIVESIFFEYKQTTFKDRLDIIAYEMLPSPLSPKVIEQVFIEQEYVSIGKLLKKFFEHFATYATAQKEQLKAFIRITLLGPKYAVPFLQNLTDKSLSLTAIALAATLPLFQHKTNLLVIPQLIKNTMILLAKKDISKLTNRQALCEEFFQDSTNEWKKDLIKNLGFQCLELFTGNFIAENYADLLAGLTAFIAETQGNTEVKINNQITTQHHNYQIPKAAIYLITATLKNKSQLISNQSRKTIEIILQQSPNLLQQALTNPHLTDAIINNYPELIISNFKNFTFNNSYVATTAMQSSASSATVASSFALATTTELTSTPDGLWLMLFARGLQIANKNFIANLSALIESADLLIPILANAHLHPDLSLSDTLFTTIEKPILAAFEDTYAKNKLFHNADAILNLLRSNVSSIISKIVTQSKVDPTIPLTLLNYNSIRCNLSAHIVLCKNLLSLAKKQSNVAQMITTENLRRLLEIRDESITNTILSNPNLTETLLQTQNGQLSKEQIKQLLDLSIRQEIKYEGNTLRILITAIEDYLKNIDDKNNIAILCEIFRHEFTRNLFLPDLLTANNLTLLLNSGNPEVMTAIFSADFLNSGNKDIAKIVKQFFDTEYKSYAINLSNNPNFWRITLGNDEIRSANYSTKLGPTLQLLPQPEDFILLLFDRTQEKFCQEVLRSPLNANSSLYNVLADLACTPLFATRMQQTFGCEIKAQPMPNLFDSFNNQQELNLQVKTEINTRVLQDLATNNGFVLLQFLRNRTLVSINNLNCEQSAKLIDRPTDIIALINRANPYYRRCCARVVLLQAHFATVKFTPEQLRTLCALAQVDSNHVLINQRFTEEKEQKIATILAALQNPVIVQILTNPNYIDNAANSTAIIALINDHEYWGNKLAQSDEKIKILQALLNSNNKLVKDAINIALYLAQNRQLPFLLIEALDSLTQYNSIFNFKAILQRLQQDNLVTYKQLQKFLALNNAEITQEIFSQEQLINLLLHNEYAFSEREKAVLLELLATNHSLPERMLAKLTTTIHSYLKNFFATKDPQLAQLLLTLLLQTKLREPFFFDLESGELKSLLAANIPEQLHNRVIDHVFDSLNIPLFNNFVGKYSADIVTKDRYFAQRVLQNSATQTLALPTDETKTEAKAKIFALLDFRNETITNCLVKQQQQAITNYIINDTKATKQLLTVNPYFLRAIIENTTWVSTVTDFALDFLNDILDPKKKNFYQVALKQPNQQIISFLTTLYQKYQQPALIAALQAIDINLIPASVTLLPNNQEPKTTIVIPPLNLAELPTIPSLITTDTSRSSTQSSTHRSTYSISSLSSLANNSPSHATNKTPSPTNTNNSVNALIPTISSTSSEMTASKTDETLSAPIVQNVAIPPPPPPLILVTNSNQPSAATASPHLDLLSAIRKGTRLKKVVAVPSEKKPAPQQTTSGVNSLFSALQTSLQKRNAIMHNAQKIEEKQSELKDLDDEMRKLLQTKSSAINPKLQALETKRKLLIEAIQKLDPYFKPAESPLQNPNSQSSASDGIITSWSTEDLATNKNTVKTNLVITSGTVATTKSATNTPIPSSSAATTTTVGNTISSTTTISSSTTTQPSRPKSSLSVTEKNGASRLPQKKTTTNSATYKSAATISAISQSNLKPTGRRISLLAHNAYPTAPSTIEPKLDSGKKL